jgi:hypothetical protein
MKRILALLLITICFSSCEKDDICAEETTPRLIMEFYDISNPANLKNVLNLKVKGNGATDFIVFNESLPIDNQNRYLFSGNKLELPLKINDSITKYSLVLNSTSTSDLPNEDLLQFKYTRQNVYVSRACGYKTIFTLNNSPNGVIRTDNVIPESFWMQNINIQTTNINTENEVHIKVFF